MPLRLETSSSSSFRPLAATWTVLPLSFACTPPAAWSAFEAGTLGQQLGADLGAVKAASAFQGMAGAVLLDGQEAVCGQGLKRGDVCLMGSTLLVVHQYIPGCHTAGAGHLLCWEFCVGGTPRLP